MTDTRQAQELRREGARQALRDLLADDGTCPDDLWLDAKVNRLFPLPAEEEPETVVDRHGCQWSFDGTQLWTQQMFTNGECESGIFPDDIPAIADLIRRHRDRAWVAEHPDGVPDPHEGARRWLVKNGDLGGTLGSSIWLPLGAMGVTITEERIALLARLLNGSRRTP